MADVRSRISKRVESWLFLWEYDGAKRVPGEKIEHMFFLGLLPWPCLRVTSDAICMWHVCVCVDHLKDVKLLSDGLAVSFLLTRFFNHELDFPIQQGAAGEHCSQRPTKTLQCFCENVPANFPVFRQWQPAKPRTGMSFFQQFSNYCTVFAIWLSCIRTSKSFEQGRRKISSHSFSLPIIKPFLSGLTEVFLHVRCIPHQ